MRTRYLLCYDVRDDARLRKTIKVAESFGYRLQYSVFLCDLSDIQRTRLEQRLREVLLIGTDRAMIVDLGPPGAASRRRFHWISDPVEVYDPGKAVIV
jgi:CRISPR-associated protein Cas2